MRKNNNLNSVGGSIVNQPEESRGKFIKFDFLSYDDFVKYKRVDGNRDVERKHLLDIAKQFRKYKDVIPPITINVVTGHICDGQHRGLSWKDLVEKGIFSSDEKIKVMFIEMPIELEKEYIIDANTNSKNWSLDDYITSFVRAGAKDYDLLENWCKSHALCISDKGNNKGKPKYRYGAAIIKGKNCQSDLKSGSFIIEVSELESADIVYDEIIEIIECFDNLAGKGPWIESLAIAWRGVRHLHEFPKWIEYMKKNRKFLLEQKTQSVENWKNIFSRINMEINL